MKRTLWFEWMVGGFCLFCSVAAMAIVWHSPVGRALVKGRPVTGIVLGSDYEDNARHSDTIMVVSYDPKNRYLDVLSIPRDTNVVVPGAPRIIRINEIFAYNFRRSGKSFDAASQAVKGMVETILSSGTAGAFEIPYYFTIDYGGFRNLINAMGGIRIRVTEPMHYDDNWGHLHIHFNPGTYLMNGSEALEYVRFRGNNADQGRQLRQQIFVKEILRRFESPLVLFRLPRYAGKLLESFHTNFSKWDLIMIALEGRRMKASNIRLFSLPGSPMGNLWKVNPDMTRQIVSLMQTPAVHGAGQSLSLPSPVAAGARAPATVEVWNASNRSNLAREVTQQLREKGFDVVIFGNFSTRQQRTLIIDRSGRFRPAQAVAAALQSANSEVVCRIDTSRQVDVSVILGNDYPVQ
jgi:LCP family protein required for cell wall assembly